MSKEEKIIEESFFFGEYTHAIDSQCRVSVPSEWRNRDLVKMILLPGRDSDLLLFPFEVFVEFLQKARKLSLANRKVQEALARIGSKARSCVCDRQGRIKLERAMLDSIKVDNQIKMIGAITHIKLCAPESWQDDFDGDNELYLDELQKITETGNSDIMQQIIENLGTKQ